MDNGYLVLSRKLDEAIMIGKDLHDYESLVIITVIDLNIDYFMLKIEGSSLWTEREKHFIIRLKCEFSIAPDITVTPHQIQRGQVKLGIRAPKDINIVREEIFKKE